MFKKFILDKNSAKILINKSKRFINLQSLQNKNLFGNGVTFAVIDTGITPVLDFCVPKNRIKCFIDFTKNNKKFAYDDNGHGTFVSGIICGNGICSNGEFSGIAPKSEIVALKALSENGEGSAEIILRAIKWIIENKQKYKIKVVCMSFGCKPKEKNDLLVFGANKLWQNGIVVVSACGNDGPNENTITSPAIATNVISVGALDDLSIGLRVADYSSRGSRKFNIFKPDIVAPGTNIVGVSNESGKEFYKLMSGTSVSAPIIAGICVLLCENYPNYSPNKIKQKLFENVIDFGENELAQGRGVFVCR